MISKRTLVVQAHVSSMLADHLREAQRLLEELGEGFSGLKVRMEELSKRLVEGRFRLAVLGQFKRGKSTLLNALIGEPLLPTGVLPLTAVPIQLRGGPLRKIWITLSNGERTEHTGSTEVLRNVLERYATERGNPGNRLGIIQVDVEHPSPLLTRGLEILDTPGVGSTVIQNTQAARAILPACDAAVFILSPDPPITEVEVQFLKAVRVAAARILFVLTKADLLSPADQKDILTFLQHVLSEQAGFSPDERIFVVSARLALEARLAGDHTLWAKSGLALFEQHLAEFLVTDKMAALHEAIQRKGARLVNEALFTLDLQRKALVLPRQELTRRAERFDAQLSALDGERLYFRDRLDGDRRRLLQEVHDWTTAMGELARKALEACLNTVRQASGPEASLTRRQEKIRAALAEEALRVFTQQADDLLQMVNARFQSIQDAHNREMNKLIDQVRRTAANLFDVPHLENVAMHELAIIREAPIFTQRWITSFTEQAASWFIRLLPPALRARRLDEQLHQEIEYLVARNTGELRWAMQQNLEDAFRAFAGRLEKQLDDTIETIRTSIRQVMDRQAQRDAAETPELERLERCRERLVQLLAVLSPPGEAATYDPPLAQPS